MPDGLMGYQSSIRTLLKEIIVLLLLTLSFAFLKLDVTCHSTTPIQRSTVCLALLKCEPPQPRNHVVQHLLESVMSRYREGEKVDCWSKTRNYIYHARDHLTSEQVEQVLDFLDYIFPNEPELVRDILQSSPRILRKSVNSNLQPTVKFLQDLYGPKLFREAISRNPNLLVASGLGYDCPNDAVECYLSGSLGLSVPTIAKLKSTHPFLFQLELDKVEAVIEFLEGKLDEGGYGDPDARRRVLGRVVISNPYLMQLSVPTNLQFRVEFLADRCELSPRDVATLIKSSPGILGLSVEGNLLPTLNYLSRLLASTSSSTEPLSGSVDKSVLRKCILSHPKLMALSLKNLETKVSYFNAIDCLNPSRFPSATSASLAARIALKSPVVYSLSLRDNIIPTVEFLARVWGTSTPIVLWDTETSEMRIEPFNQSTSFINEAAIATATTDSLKQLLHEYPSILTLSLEGNIQPTLNFFNRTGYITLTEDWRMQRLLSNDTHAGVTLRGRYMAASLFHRLLPRWHFCISQQLRLRQPQQHNDANDDAASDYFVTTPPLHLLVGATDPEFCRQLGLDFKEFIKFKSLSVPRLKFSSQFDTWLKTGRPIDA